MTTQDAIDYLTDLWCKDILSVDVNNALGMAIKALESKDVLDKIRTEVEALAYLDIEDGSDGYDQYIKQYEVLKIIDKYRAESEN